MITIKNLYKNYGSVEAVKGISLEVKKGEMFGLIGPDGAGKTTTIKILCGLVNATEGEVHLMNRDINKNRTLIQRDIGYLSQIYTLYGDLTVDENIEFFANIHNIKNYEERRNELLEFTGLKKFRTRLSENLSGGMKQKLSLACSLIHKPKILFLDEPTTGVDPVSRRDFWKILSNLMKEGITIFLTTPYLDEAERCSRVAFMNNGKILDVGTPESLKAKMNAVVVEVITSNLQKAYKLIKEKSNFDVQLFGDRVNIVLKDYEEDFRFIENILNKGKIEIIEKRIITPSLENLFIHLMKN